MLQRQTRIYKDGLIAHTSRRTKGNKRKGEEGGERTGRKRKGITRGACSCSVGILLMVINKN